VFIRFEPAVQRGGAICKLRPVFGFEWWATKKSSGGLEE
jgi:hypothetical protein